MGGTHIPNIPNPSVHVDVVCLREVDGAGSCGVLVEAADCNSGRLGMFESLPALGLSNTSCCGRVTLFGSDQAWVSYTMVCVDNSYTLPSVCWVKLLCHRKKKIHFRNIGEASVESLRRRAPEPVKPNALLQVLINSVFIQKEAQIQCPQKLT